MYQIHSKEFYKQVLALQTENINWCTHQRYTWILECLIIYGFINREHICKKFRVSTCQSSIDLKFIRNHFPNNVRYDPSEKQYIWIES